MIHLLPNDEAALKKLKEKLIEYIDRELIKRNRYERQSTPQCKFISVFESATSEKLLMLDTKKYKIKAFTFARKTLMEVVDTNHISETTQLSNEMIRGIVRKKLNIDADLIVRNVVAFIIKHGGSTEITDMYKGTNELLLHNIMRTSDPYIKRLVSETINILSTNQNMKHFFMPKRPQPFTPKQITDLENTAKIILTSNDDRFVSSVVDMVAEEQTSRHVAKRYKDPDEYQLFQLTRLCDLLIDHLSSQTIDILKSNPSEFNAELYAPLCCEGKVFSQDKSDELIDQLTKGANQIPEEDINKITHKPLRLNINKIRALLNMRECSSIDTPAHTGTSQFKARYTKQLNLLMTDADTTSLSQLNAIKFLTMPADMTAAIKSINTFIKELEQEEKNRWSWVRKLQLFQMKHYKIVTLTKLVENIEKVYINNTTENWMDLITVAQNDKELVRSRFSHRTKNLLQNIKDGHPEKGVFDSTSKENWVSLGINTKRFV